MSEHKIILCTTFREFDESENSKIQHLFLDSICNQDYDDYLIVVTTFGEKKVEEVLKEKFDSKCVIYSETLEGYRYSLSSVFLNGLKEALKYDKSILLWCTCDIILQKNYFSTMSKLYKDNYVGTTHPNKIASNVEQYKNHNYKFRAMSNDGFDILFFSTEIFKKKKNREILNNYYFYEWGIFEHFLIGLALLNDCSMINLINLSNVIKLENDRAASKETSEFLLNSWKKNYKILEKCFKETDMNYHVRELEYCHYSFKTVRYNLKYIGYQAMNYAKYLKKKKYNDNFFDNPFEIDGT